MYNRRILIATVGIVLIILAMCSVKLIEVVLVSIGTIALNCAGPTQDEVDDGEPADPGSPLFTDLVAQLEKEKNRASAVAPTRERIVRGSSPDRSYHYSYECPQGTTSMFNGVIWVCITSIDGTYVGGNCTEICPNDYICKDAVCVEKMREVN